MPTVFEDHTLHTRQKAILPCQYNGHQYMIELEVLDQDALSIIGLPTSIEMDLVCCVDTLDTQGHLCTKLYEQYIDVSDGLGSISDILYQSILLTRNLSTTPCSHQAVTKNSRRT